MCSGDVKENKKSEKHVKSCEKRRREEPQMVYFHRPKKASKSNVSLFCMTDMMLNYLHRKVVSNVWK